MIAKSTRYKGAADFLARMARWQADNKRLSRGCVVDEDVRPSPGVLRLRKSSSGRAVGPRSSGSKPPSHLDQVTMAQAAPNIAVPSEPRQGAVHTTAEPRRRLSASSSLTGMVTKAEEIASTIIYAVDDTGGVTEKIRPQAPSLSRPLSVIEKHIRDSTVTEAAGSGCRRASLSADYMRQLKGEGTKEQRLGGHLEAQVKQAEDELRTVQELVERMDANSEGPLLGLALGAVKMHMDHLKRQRDDQCSRVTRTQKLLERRSAELEAMVKERDGVRNEYKAAKTERDTLHKQVEALISKKQAVEAWIKASIKGCRDVEISSRAGREYLVDLLASAKQGAMASATWTASSGVHGRALVPLLHDLTESSVSSPWVGPDVQPHAAGETRHYKGGIGLHSEPLPQVRHQTEPASQRAEFPRSSAGAAGDQAPSMTQEEVEAVTRLMRLLSLVGTDLQGWFNILVGRGKHSVQPADLRRHIEKLNIFFPQGRLSPGDIDMLLTALSGASRSTEGINLQRLQETAEMARGLMDMHSAARSPQPSRTAALVMHPDCLGDFEPLDFGGQVVRTGSRMALHEHIKDDRHLQGTIIDIKPAKPEEGGSEQCILTSKNAVASRGDDASDGSCLQRQSSIKPAASNTGRAQPLQRDGTDDASLHGDNATPNSCLEDYTMSQTRRRDMANEAAAGPMMPQRRGDTAQLGAHSTPSDPGHNGSVGSAPATPARLEEVPTPVRSASSAVRQRPRRPPPPPPPAGSGSQLKTEQATASSSGQQCCTQAALCSSKHRSTNSWYVVDGLEGAMQNGVIERTRKPIWLDTKDGVVLPSHDAASATDNLNKVLLVLKVSARAAEAQAFQHWRLCTSFTSPYSGLQGS